MATKTQREEKQRVFDARRAALVQLGVVGGGRTGLMYEQSAARALGVTPTALRALCVHAREVPNPHYRSGSPSRLYDPCTLLNVRDAAPTEQARRRRNRKPVDYAAKFTRRYANWRAGLAAAADSMFNLNRYTKHATCSRAHKDAIYHLKTEFLCFLCDEGFVTHRGVHSHTNDPRWYYERCDECQGTGCACCNDGEPVVVPGQTKKFTVLRFQIGETSYTWHQPGQFVTRLRHLPRLPPGDWAPGDAAKPIALPRGKFAEAKALVAWVVAEAEAATGGDVVPVAIRDRANVAGA